MLCSQEDPRTPTPPPLWRLRRTSDYIWKLSLKNTCRVQQSLQLRLPSRSPRGSPPLLTHRPTAKTKTKYKTRTTISTASKVCWGKAVQLLEGGDVGLVPLGSITAACPGCQLPRLPSAWICGTKRRAKSGPPLRRASSAH